MFYEVFMRSQQGATLELQRPGCLLFRGEELSRPEKDNQSTARGLTWNPLGLNLECSRSWLRNLSL